MFTFRNYFSWGLEIGGNSVEIRRFFGDWLGRDWWGGYRRVAFLFIILLVIYKNLI